MSPGHQATTSAPAGIAEVRRTGLARLRDPGFLLSSARRAGRSSLMLARMPAAAAGMLPGFLIVGGQRCGTTSMTRALREHPSVFGAAMHLEVHYFDGAYDRGLAWYRSHFPLRASARLATRAAGASPVAFESSPYYMFHPLAAERISRDLPGVKLLVLLRDPVERANSGHAHETFLGFETETFERALEREPARLEGEVERILADPAYISRSHQHHAYRARGEYAWQLERLERIFGRERIHVVDSDAFFADPGPAYDGVLEFLGLPRSGHPVFKRRNSRSRAPMTGAVRAALEEHYQPHDERLARWLGYEPRWRAEPAELRERRRTVTAERVSSSDTGCRHPDQ